MKQATYTTLAVSAAALLLAGQAFAHTGVRDKVTVKDTAGASSYNGFTITHGCGGDSGDAYPVLGQGAVFPTGDRVAWREIVDGEAGEPFAHGGGAGIFDTLVKDENGDPAVDPETGDTLPDPGLNMGITGYSSVASAFASAQEIVDPNALNPGVVEGLFWKDGAMEPKLNTVTPFKVTVPAIIDPSIKQVNVRIAVVNFCDIGKNAANDAAGPYNEPHDAFGRKIPILATSLAPDQINANGAPTFKTLRKGNGDNNRADWWFTALDGGSSRWNDPELLQPTYWTTMTVINSSATGDRVVSVEPTGEAVDAILTGPNTRPFSRGDSNL